jgi:hypothetical protein
MIRSNTSILLKSVLWDFFGNIIYFPIWWYTRGLKRVGLFFINFVSSMEMRLAVRIWIVNLFRPMYAVTDIPGRIISFFMRLSMIITRSLALIVIVFVSLILFAVYLVWPLFLVIMILIQFGTAFIT